MEAGVNFPILLCDYENSIAFSTQKQIENVIYMRPSALPSIFSRNIDLGLRKKGELAIKTVFRLLKDPIPEIMRYK